MMADDLEVSKTLVNPTRESWDLMIDALYAVVTGYEAAINTTRANKIEFRKKLLLKLQSALKSTIHD
jgi:hypothetical protein